MSKKQQTERLVKALAHQGAGCTAIPSESSVSAYYNENDAQKAACLREFMRANLIAPGEVDERSIKDVDPADLRGFTQCHFFAGFGVWSYALRLAGWPDARPVWTGSAPCPGYSCAGKGQGFNDPRDLWPSWAPLIVECQPPVVFGEQSKDAIGFGWLDRLYVDLEAAAYSVGAAVLGACSVGAPHIRQRLYFGAHATKRGIGTLNRKSKESAGWEESPRGLSIRVGGESARGGRAQGRPSEAVSGKESCGQIERSGNAGRSPDSDGVRRSGSRLSDGLQPNESGLFERREASETVGYRSSTDAASSFGDCADSPRTGETTAEQPRRRDGIERTMFDSQPLSPRLEGHFGDVRDWRGPGWLDPHTARSVAGAGATRGFWGDCDWWHARDEKYRPIEPGIFPLAHGASNRVLKLRGYGDAIIPQVAAEFIQAASGGL